MSKITNWGHWVVAALLAFKGVGLLYEIAVDFPRQWRHPDTLTYPSDYVGVALCALYLVSAWGILRWRRWAHTSTVALSLVELALVGVMISMDRSADLLLDIRIAWWPAINLVVFVWLVLPAVRSSYRPRPQTA